MPKEVFAKAGVEGVDFATLLKTSDYVSIHSPLVPETKGLFNADAFKQMKKSGYVVNTARGPIIDEAALAAALDAEEIAGAALDVMTQEPPATRLRSSAATTSSSRRTPASTPRSRSWSCRRRRREEVVAVLSGKAPRNPVNPEAF